MSIGFDDTEDEEEEVVKVEVSPDPLAPVKIEAAAVVNNNNSRTTFQGGKLLFDNFKFTDVNGPAPAKPFVFTLPVISPPLLSLPEPKRKIPTPSPACSPQKSEKGSPVPRQVKMSEEMLELAKDFFSSDDDDDEDEEEVEAEEPAAEPEELQNIKKIISSIDMVNIISDISRSFSVRDDSIANIDMLTQSLGWRARQNLVSEMKNAIITTHADMLTSTTHCLLALRNVSFTVEKMDNIPYEMKQSFVNNSKRAPTCMSSMYHCAVVFSLGIICPYIVRQALGL